MTVFTKRGVDVAAPVDSAGNPRQPVPQEFQRLFAEYEALLLALGAGELDIEFPYGFITATNAGDGTANAIEATTDRAIPDVDGGALIALPIVAENTASPVTVSFNGGAALTVKNVDGNDPQIGDLTAGMIVAGYLSGSDFRLISDPSSVHNKDAAEAAQAAAESAETGAQTAQTGAEAARDIAAGYASDAVSQGNVPIYATVSGMSALEVPAGINAIRTNGYSAAGDGGGGLYIDQDNGRGVAFTTAGDTARSWYRADDSVGAAVWDSGKFRTMQERARYVAYSGDFDVDASGNNDSTSGLIAMLAEHSARAELAPGTFEVSETLVYDRGATGFGGRGRKFEGAGKRQTVIRNSTTSDPLFAFGDAVNDRDGLDGFLTGISFAGNPTTTAGIQVLGGDDDGLTQASRGVILRDCRVTDIGAGSAYRLSAWKARMDACEAEDCFRGLEIGNQVYSFLSTGFYCISATNEAVYAAAGLAGSKTNSLAMIGSVFQGCGAAGQMVLIGGGANWHFGNTYMEVPSSGCTAAWRVGADARNVNIKGVNYSKGGGPTVDLIETAATTTHVEDLSIYGDIASYVKLIGTNRQLTLDQVEQVTGSVTEPIDVSGATDPDIRIRSAEHLQDRLPRVVHIGNNDLVLWDRSSGSPEGVVSAPPGSIVGVRSGTDAGVWGKASGNDKTGWVKLT